MTRIVNYVHRYKRPPKRKPITIEGPAIVRKRASADATPPRPAEDPTPANDDDRKPPPGARKSAIVTIRRKSRFGDTLDLSPDELKRRADAADALWRELVRRNTEGK